MIKKEASARIKINKLLEEAGWRFFDDENGKFNIVLEGFVRINPNQGNELGDDFEKTKKGFIDYLLLDSKNFPVCVLEAKSEEKEPLEAKEQARKYAQSINVRFIILSNGNIHYFWDLEKGNPYLITNFPNLESINYRGSFEPSPGQLVQETVTMDYIARSQNQNYDKDPRWLDENDRLQFIKENNLKFLRKYQIKAVQHLQNSVKEGKDRFLFEMATGTGKTLVSGAVIKLFLKTGNARRVLFLVDRLELEDQAKKNFIKYLKNDYTTIVYKEHRKEWRKAEIVISTVQSLLVDAKYRKLFSPTDFDLVISDEAHRSIGGNARALFEYFVGYKLGLTATPKDYIKNLSSKIAEQDPRMWERRQLLDTYKTFGCESGEPTFRYSLIDGVKDGFLVNPIVVDARTEITTELLSEKGYSVMVEDENGRLQEEIFIERDFEKEFYSEKTNDILCKAFMENALCDPISGEIGKTIVFCVSQKHAAKITQYLNTMADQMFPGKYQSDFAIQVTSNVQDAQQFTINFANNNLMGNSRFLDGYKTSKARVCVTVGMMTTGYDCEDLLNLCLMRPIFSPTNFIQIKGRGTRKFTFEYRVQEDPVTADKKNYKMFDFFANCEYFEKKFNYDEVIALPSASSPSVPNPFVTKPLGAYDSVKPDPLKTMQVTDIGLDGMRIDRELYKNKFEDAVKANPFIKENYVKEKLEDIEEYIKKELFNKPEDYFDLEKLRKAYGLDRRLTVRELLEKILGNQPDFKFKSKDELLEEEFEKFLSIYRPENKFAMAIKHFLKAYITDGEIRDIIDNKEFSRLATNSKLSLDDYKAVNGYMEIIPQYVKDYVPLNIFMI